MGHQGMKSSLVSRDVIADSVELTMRGHSYDALVGIAGCDKSLPGMMMALVRLNVPGVFLYGGSILPGRFRGKDVTVMDVYEYYGKLNEGEVTEEDLAEIEAVACPSGGSCGGQFTANTMACVSEAIGLALPHSAGAPAVYESRDEFAVASGNQVMALIESNLRPRDIVTRKALENAATVVAATGGSTNAGLHLPAIAHEAGIDFDLAAVAEVFKRTPYIADLKPGGRYVAKDLFEAGGVPIVLKALLDGGYLHGDCLTVTGRTLAENLADVSLPTGQDVVVPTSAPLSPTGSVVGLHGNLAPEGAIVKVAGLTRLRHVGPARCFDTEEEAMKAVVSRDYRSGDVIVIRYEGPKGGPGMREMLAVTSQIYGPGQGRGGRAHHRWPLLRRDARLLHRPCGAGGCGRRPHRPAARRRRGDHRRHQRRAQRRALGRRAGRTPQGLGAALARLSVGRALEVRRHRWPRLSGRGDTSRRRGGNPLLRGHLTARPPQPGPQHHDGGVSDDEGS